MGGTLPFGMAHRNALVAPIPAIRGTLIEPQESTLKGVTRWPRRRGRGADRDTLCRAGGSRSTADRCTALACEST